MKKTFIALFIIIILFFFMMSIKTESIETFNYQETSDTYFLDFSNDNLNTKNLKLKIAPFTGYKYKINKVYPKKIINKEYYSYNFNNIDVDIENFTKEYISNLENEYLYDEIDRVKRDGIDLVGIELCTEKDALTIFKNKFKKVKIISINNENYKK